MKKLFNIYSRKVNKEETHAFFFNADLNMGDSRVVCEHGSAYFRITLSVSMPACVCASFFFFSPVYSSVLRALLLCLDKSIYADRV